LFEDVFVLAHGSERHAEIATKVRHTIAYPLSSIGLIVLRQDDGIAGASVIRGGAVVMGREPAAARKHYAVHGGCNYCW